VGSWDHHPRRRDANRVIGFLLDVTQQNAPEKKRPASEARARLPKG
jgi:hypothetical protein